ncbi:8-amino-7-oxononanoate synthase [Chitinophaga skermanii]|uniref:8-amino-7-oxononanoate synthase n=1 Tax=Chitinophaga skermanii TaxID=331697 RepID=A0A327QZ11_9BACT|nr:8-amino-7-oxononanoate synthase [Chitinophaga skermanii]RAJ08894.1 8-amino-7-oxononanoate synthase [Chitinophaga skermanii]
MGLDFLQSALDKREAEHAYRTLRLAGDKVDFCSNDYLGLARSEIMQEQIHLLSKQIPQLHGSGGSRLLAGNYELVELAEKSIAAFHQAESGLIFNSGYDANVGLFSSVPKKGDVIVYDSLIHASIRDGMRLSTATTYSFNHNNLADLQKKLDHARSVATGQVFVAVESVYSMDGDQPPLADIVGICEKFDAHLIVDEAHATGVIGENGEGLAQALGLEGKCFARVYTFGKAVGCHGAIVVGATPLRHYLINFARSFIYTTAIPPMSIAAILASYELFPGMHEQRQQLQSHIAYLSKHIAKDRLLESATPIQIVKTPGNAVARTTAAYLQAAGFDVRPILHPTVPKGEERLRIVLHSFNSTEEVAQLVAALQQAPTS